MGQEQIVIKYDELLRERDKWRDLYEDANSALVIATEGLQYYARNPNKFVNWRAQKALQEMNLYAKTTS